MYPSFRHLLALGAVCFAAQPAAAATIIGTRDESFIYYVRTGADEVFDYASPSVRVEGSAPTRDFPGAVVTGSYSWVIEGQLDNWLMRGRAESISGTVCAPQRECFPDRTSNVVRVDLYDRVIIGQPITSPVEAVLRMRVDGVMAATPGGMLDANFILNAIESPPTGGAVNRLGQPGPYDFVLEDRVTLPPGQTGFDVFASMSLAVTPAPDPVGAFARADFANTAVLDLVLPAGFTFTTQGGFTGSRDIGQPGTPIPEPMSVAILAAGLLGLVGLRGYVPRRRFSLRGADLAD